MLPALAPDGHAPSSRQHARPHRRQRPARFAVPAPWREPVVQAAGQTRQRLKQIEDRREDLLLVPDRTRRGAVGEQCPCRGQTGLHDQDAHRERQQRERAQQWPPQDAEGGDRNEEQDDQIPFRHGEDQPHRGRRALVQRLKGRAAPDPVVDSSGRAEERRGLAAIHASGPRDVADPIVPVGPLARQLRLGLPILPLLLPVCADGVAAVMPDHGRRAESQSPAAITQPPAQIDIVPGDAKLWIESADRPQALGPEGHVAPWDMFRLAI